MGRASVSLRAWLAACSVAVATLPALGQTGDVNAGRIVYTTPQVIGFNSCSASACHTINPGNNQNRILKGADDPGAIGLAISRVTQMAFLKGKLTSTQFLDLAAYIGNPGAATGTPAAQVAPAVLSFSSTVVGTSATAQPVSITNTGTATLVVGGVTSGSADFPVTGSCGSIAAGASCNVSVGFAPTVPGARSGTITVTHNAASGESTVAVSGTATAPVALAPAIQLTPTTLAFGTVTVGSFSGVQLLTVASTGTAPLTLTGVAVSNAAFAVVLGGSCSAGVPIAVGATCTVAVRFSPSTAGAQTGTINISHDAGPVAAAVSLSGTAVTGTSSNLKTMVEYVYVPLNYYFVTSRDDDKATLDAIAGFQRTGLSFQVYATQTGSAKAISRFYFDKVAVNGSRGSHFYTLLDEDKAALRALNPSNAQTPRLPHDEGVDSWAFLPVVAGPGGSCASGQLPVYRLFRGGLRFPDDPNHRFTSDVATYNAFVAQGWDGEGVNFCVPSP